jgi:hypothetical protein
MNKALSEQALLWCWNEGAVMIQELTEQILNDLYLSHLIDHSVCVGNDFDEEEDNSCFHVFGEKATIEHNVLRVVWTADGIRRGIILVSECNTEILIGFSVCGNGGPAVMFPVNNSVSEKLYVNMHKAILSAFPS